MPPANVKRYRLESTGINAGAHGQHQRALDDVGRDMSAVDERFDSLDASQIAYTPTTSGDWVAPAPTTVQQALDRLAAAGGTTPVP